MPTIDFNYAHVPTIARFSNSDAFIRALLGPFGSGKSSGCVVEFPYRAQNQAPSITDGIRRTRWLVVRNSYRQLKDTTLQTVFNWIPPHYFGRWYESDYRYEVNTFRDTSFELLFRALDKPGDIGKLLSLDLTGAWLNEYREIPWPIVEIIQGRIGRYPPRNEGGCTWSGMWMDSNPPDTDSRSYKFFEEEEWRASYDKLKKAGKLPPGVIHPEDYASIFHQPSGRSPQAENLVNLPVGYYDRLAIGKTDEWIKVYIDGEYGFVTDDKIVFPEYSDRNHLRKYDPVPGVAIERNWDWGLTPCCTFSQMLPSGQWLVFDEIIATGMGADRFSDQVLEHCSRAFRGHASFDDIGDPAGDSRAQTDERTCFEIVRAKGINIFGGEQNPQLRIESLRKPLRTLGDNGEPRFALHPRCRNTRKAFMGGYHYRRLATSAERFDKDPEKNHPYSDLMDSLEYRAVEHFGAGLTGRYQQDDYPYPGYAPQRDARGKSKVTGY